MTKKTYILDGSRFTTLFEFAYEFSRVCLVKWQWNGNLDALDDILSGGFGTPDEGFCLVWRNAALSKHALGYAETVRWYQEIIQKCHPTNVGAVKKRMALAQQEQGQTLFELILEIIKEHRDIELILE